MTISTSNRILPALLPLTNYTADTAASGVRVLVDGVSTPLHTNSLSVDNTVGQRSACSLMLVDATGAYHYSEGQRIDVLDANNALIYSGVLDSDDESMPDSAVSSGLLYHKVTCKDWHYLADKRLVATSYASGQTCAAVITDLIANWLAEEGVVAAPGGIATGVTLPDVVFNYCTAAAALDALAQKAGAYWWQIDQYKRLWFQPYTALAAPWALTSSGGVVTDARFGTVRVKRAKPLYRNTQYIRGATGTTSTQTETRKGDGSTKAFTFGYPFAKVPTVTVNSVSKTVGIKGLDSGKDWYWNAGDATLTQDSAGTTLISTDTLQVVYVGTYPLIIISADDAQVSAQQTLEGGGTSGKVEDITEDASLTTTDAAFTEAAALLAKYGQTATTLQFQTKRAGLAPGQLLSVTIPEHGFTSASFLIESVHISDEDGQVIWYDVTAIQGPVNTTWVQFFGQLVSNANTSSDTLNVGASTALVIAANFTGSITPTATYTATVYACPIVGPATLCGPTVIVC